MNNRLLFLFTLLFSTTLFSQDTNTCGFDHYWQYQSEKNPQGLETLKLMEAYTKKYVEKHQKQSEKIAEVITIPVVFHVVYTSNRPASNISEAKIYSQLEALNRDFRRLNADTANILADFKPFMADIEVEFCLATRDPNGYPTTGITRTATSLDRFFVETDEIKSSETGGKDPWPFDQYLNIWVCYNICSTFGGCGILGYAVPPSFSTPETDGVVIQYNYFGTTAPVNPTFNEGRTAVHEVGHWLSLLHTWGNGEDNANCTKDDLVADTPLTDGPTFGCAANHANSCIEEELDLPDMTENYMDYGNDACLTMFTTGQKLRMRATLDEGGFRHSLLNSMGCVPVEQGMDDVRVVFVSYPNDTEVICSVFEPELNVENFGTEPLESFTVNYDLDGETYSYEWMGLIEPLKSGTITLPALQIAANTTQHVLNISIVAPNGREDFNIENNYIAVSFQSVAPATQTIAFSESFQSPPGFPFPPIGWGIFNGDNDFNFRFKKSNLTGYSDTESGYMPNFEADASYIGTIDEIISPAINFEGVYDSLYLQFFYAYTGMGEGTISDTLEILLSVDCGSSYFTVRKFFGEELITSDPVDEAFVPMEGQWKEGLVNFLPFKDYRNVKLKIRQIRGTGNDLYVDDINLLSGLTAIEGYSLQNQVSIHAYPNPVRGKTIIELNHLIPNQNVELSISNNAGQVVYQQTIRSLSTQKTLEIPVENLSNGMYVLSLQSQEQRSHTKIVVAH
ncbi:MAG: M43 family zinc metalloprotease [Chitinophagales bacterium]